MKASSNIFSFRDFREYLKGHFRGAPRQSDLPGDSRREEAFWSYLRLVIDGRISLGKSAREDLARELNLTPLEAKYFCTLIRYQQSKDPQHQKTLQQLQHLYAQLSPDKSCEIVLYMDSI